MQFFKYFRDQNIGFKLSYIILYLDINNLINIKKMKKFLS